MSKILGHLFVVRGDLFKLQCDARIVSGQRRPDLRPGSSWMPAADEGVVPTLPLGGERFQLWRRGGTAGGGAQAQPDTWVVDVTDVIENGVKATTERIRQLITAITEDLLHQELAKGSNGDPAKSPVIVLPFLGTGRAGGKALKADLLRDFLKSLAALADDLGAAVVLTFLVRPREQNHPYKFTRKQLDMNATAYSMAQALRRSALLPRARSGTLPDAFERLRSMAIARRLAVFVGAGASRSAGLPGWLELLAGLREDCARLLRETGSAQPALPEETAFKELDPLLQGQVLAEYWPGGTREEKRKGLNEALRTRVKAERYGLQHALLAALPVTEYVTTNYDDLLERAITGSGLVARAIPAGKATGWSDDDPAVRRVLKLHGSAEARPAGADEAPAMILTAQDYLRFQNESAALGGAVQGLMISHYLLFVGFGMTDPNFLRLHDGVARLLPADGSMTDREKDAVGTALLVEREAWKVDFADLLLRGIRCRSPAGVARERSGEAGSDAGRSFGEQVRLLEILLDDLGVLCADGVGYAQDPEYRDLLDEGDRWVLKVLQDLGSLAGATPLQDQMRALLVRAGIH